MYLCTIIKRTKSIIQKYSERLKHSENKKKSLLLYQPNNFDGNKRICDRFYGTKLINLYNIFMVN